MKNYEFAPISAREYPTVKLLDHPYIWGGVQFCVNLSEKPYSPKLVSAMVTHGIEWTHCPVSEEPGACWVDSFAKALPELYRAYEQGKKLVVHCDCGNNRSKSLVEAFYYLLKLNHFQDEYKGEMNHLAYNCKMGHLPPLEQVELRLRWMRWHMQYHVIYDDAKVDWIGNMERSFKEHAKPLPFRRQKRHRIIDDGYSGTPLLQSLADDMENYKAGRPIDPGTTVDQVEMTVLDDWDVVGSTFDDNGPVDMYAPLFTVKGEDRSERLFPETEIEGFTPVRGHEYQLRVRRFYLTKDYDYHYYELLEIISDKLTNH